jgi:hypothetical protein
MKDSKVNQHLRKLDRQLVLTLKFMDETPIMQQISKMSPEAIEGLPESERKKLKSDVLDVVENAIRKAKMLTEVKS